MAGAHITGIDQSPATLQEALSRLRKAVLICGTSATMAEPMPITDRTATGAPSAITTRASLVGRLSLCERGLKDAERLRATYYRPG